MLRFPFLSLPAMAVAACAPNATTGNGSVDVNASAARAQGTGDAYSANAADGDTIEIAEPEAATNADEVDSRAPLDPPAPGTPGGLPDDRTPVSEARFTPDSAQGAADVVQTYYALIGEKKYAEAFALREPGTSGAAAFAAGFARFSEYHANVGAPGRIDAGAGQRYVTVPVQVYARLTSGGTPVYQLGSVVLHRAGDIDGATAAQRSWRIRSIDLKPTPRR